MHNLNRTVRPLVPLLLLAGEAMLAMPAGCADRPAKPPGPPADSTGRLTGSAATRDDSAAASAGRAGEPNDQKQTDQARKPGPISKTPPTGSAGSPPSAAHIGAPSGQPKEGPFALDGSDEGPVADLPLIITLPVPEVPEKIRSPTPMPEQ